MHRPVVGVIGAGRVGTALAARLRHVGHPVVVSARSEASRLRAATTLPGVPVLDPADVVDVADVVLLTVPDDSLAELASTLPFRTDQVVAHTSGRHGLTALIGATATGARTLALHPAMTFTGAPTDGADPIDCVFGLTVADEDRQLAADLVAELGGRPMWVDEADRVTYHAALAHGANHLVTLVNQAADLLRSLDTSVDPADVLRPLLTAALDNALAYGDAALTGPVARGDVETVRAHLDALVGSPARPAYVAMAEATAARVAAQRTDADDALDARGAEGQPVSDETAKTVR